MRLAHYQHPVEYLSAQGADEAFANRGHARSLDGRSRSRPGDRRWRRRHRAGASAAAAVVTAVVPVPVPVTTRTLTAAVVLPAGCPDPRFMASDSSRLPRAGVTGQDLPEVLVDVLRSS